MHVTAHRDAETGIWEINGFPLSDLMSASDACGTCCVCACSIVTHELAGTSQTAAEGHQCSARHNTHTDVAYMAIIPIFLATLPWEVAMRVCDVIV